MNQPEHGLRTTYTNWKCRCEACTAANTRYVRERREARRVMLAKPDAPNDSALWARQCPECHNRMPDDFEACPSCGHEMEDS